MKQTTKSLCLSAALSLAASFSFAATTAYTDPVGALSITCLANSDTYIAVPFAKAAEFQGAATGLTGTAAEATAVITTSATFAASYVNLYYVRFTSGALNGRYYTITANDQSANSTITIDKNGENWSSLTITGTETFKLVKYWTVGELFPFASQIPFVNVPADFTTGKTFVYSSGNLANNRRSEMFIPNNSSPGVNLAPNRRLFVKTTGWTESISGFPDASNVVLIPDSYFIVRNPSTVTSNTSFIASGSVETGNNVLSLNTLSSGSQDNFLGLARPKDVTLQGLGLSATDFVNSNGNLANNRKDELYFFNNAVSGINKAPARRFFRVTVTGVDVWREAVSGFPTSDTFTIPAGSGFFIRKAATVGAVTSFYSNVPNY